MPRETITTANAPSSPLYSQGVKAGPHVLVSGIVGIDPATGILAGGTIQGQHARRWQTARPSSMPVGSPWTTLPRWECCSPTLPTSPP
jgi:enamine deaminase RidA (YjgF/YER057c/UK114 family)